MRADNEKENAYFTVEAALVLPIVIGVILFLIYSVFFQYNRCLMEQDVGALALKGCSIQADDKSLLMLQLEEYADNVYEKKYIAWGKSRMEIKLEGRNIQVIQRGKLKFSLGSLLLGETEKNWDTTAEFENQRIDPVGLIRIYRKITGGA